MSHLTSINHPFSLTGNTTLAREASGSLHREHTRLKRKFLSSFSTGNFQGSSGTYMKKVWKQKYQENQKHIA